MRTEERPARAAAGSASGPAEEETVRLARKHFRRRRMVARLRRWRPWLLTLAALALTGFGVWLVFGSSYVTAERTEVNGATTLPAARVISTAQVPVGRPLARVDLDAVRARVEQLPPVRAARVSRSWPHTVRIEVDERVPLAVVDQGAGLRAVDSEGVLFGSHGRRPADLPLLRTGPKTDAEALAEGARVVAALSDSVARQVDFVEVSTIDQIKLVLRDGRKVTWGSAEQAARKAAVLTVLLQQKGTEYDVSVPARPTLR